MKKILLFALVVAMLLPFAACSKRDDEVDVKAENSSNTDNTGNTDNAGNTDNSQETVKHTGKKIDGRITGASVFSEGLAFVSVNGDKEKTYCINKDGYIVFELDFRTVDPMGYIGSKFINGQAKVGEGICDTKGKVTMPADVGATAFCAIPLEGGYIIAEKITSTYDSSKKELGVMNTKFEWIVSPSVDLYDSLGGIDLPVNTQCFYYNDYFYFESAQKYLNLKTGEIKDQIDNFPSKQWYNNDKNFYDYNGNEMLNLESNETISMPAGTAFVNGKAPIRFINQETNKYYFTVIDEKGNFLFEPIETITFQNFVFDGKTILILDSYIDPQNIVSYNIDGQLLGQIDTETVQKNHSFSCYLNEGVVLLKAGYNFNYVSYYYDTSFKPLF